MRKRREAHAGDGGQARGQAGGNFVRIYGFHAVAAALNAPRRKLIRLYATAAAAERLSGDISRRGVEMRLTTAEDIPRGYPETPCIRA